MDNGPESVTPAVSVLSQLCLDRYPIVKASHPGEGRRRWKLRVADEFWASSPDAKTQVAQGAQRIISETVAGSDFSKDRDPYDDLSTDAQGLGILLRTDYSDEGAWTDFCAKLDEAQRQLLSDFGAENSEEAGANERSPQTDGDVEMLEEEEEEDDDDDEASPVFAIINPPSPASREILTSISNLTALRLLNDVDIRAAPVRPQGTKPMKPPNRLVDHSGWQEIYTGKTVWIYDKKSNTDQCVRLVSQKADMYGTATADSWRARVSHICELQVNLASGAMAIDFGGLDRWDYTERVRNLEEALQPIR
ncbi:hypothetical protein JAAARDRAFT_35373 [Jaapia argillacea MUCL 33604]|uniref:Uncharacterized protein n=1 Tax=Jaapia argillacea MUCL 33604 TaxID=933084 RepID=A0A067PS96_9AGAM|nr:hypothetical protein JAAARDRAFT_35373 [Jaapia argillacea MUCL 33604]